MESSELKALWVLSVVLLLSNWTHGKRVPQAPCYFVYGDSLFDNGNNNYLNTAPKVNYLPYGMDFDSGASGRCSNGLNIADTIAEQLGFDSYITHFGVGGCTSFLDGVNYGSSGAGILDITGSKSSLYRTGARKIALFGLIRVGCMPYNIQRNMDKLDASSCAYELNNDVQIFNGKLRNLVEKLNNKHSDARFTYINSYEIDSDNQTNKGFTYTRESCCLVEPRTVPCKSLSVPCSNRDDYVYWDGAHFTEAKAWAFGKRAYKRQSPTDAYPYDISELAKLKLDDFDAYNINHAEL
uniref:SGNH hydrolase-type esterase domain-containing protein n=2 Tax=Salix viminalis TaxID=40686 RepID=A0A6N2MD54_SALVM